MKIASFRPGEEIGPYRIVRKIGQGGMGEVYEAWEEELHRRIAIKILSPTALEKPELEERFKAEARALARLKHPNIVAVYTLGKHHDRIMMVMEFVDGWVLDNFLCDYPCGLAGILKLFRQMLEGMGAAHAAGIIHRDIKPQNIMVERSLNVKVLDFGICKLHQELHHNITESGVFVGTLNYLAPEIVAGGDASKQSDVYSLGLVLYYMLTGSLPFNGRNQLEVMEKIRSTSIAFNPDSILPAEIKQLVLNMTNRSLHGRFRDTKEVLAALSKIKLEGLPQELRNAQFPHMFLKNAEELRTHCQRLGYDPSEARLIINLAASIQTKNRPAGNWDEPMHVTQVSLTDAIHRFNTAKAHVTGRMRFPKNLSSQYLLPGALMTAAAIFAGTVLVRTAPRRHASHPETAAAPPERFPEPPPAAPEHLPEHMIAELPTERAIIQPEPVAAPSPAPAEPVKPESKPVAAAQPPKKMSATKTFSAPVVIGPVDNMIFESNSPLSFSWQAVNGFGSGRKYEVTIKSVTNKSFKRTEVTSQPELLVKELPSGYYVWTVRALSDNGAHGPASEVRTFELKPAIVAQPAPPSKPTKTASPASFKPVLLPVEFDEKKK